MYENILEILVRSYVSVINATSILGRAVRECGASPAALSAQHLPALLPRIERDVALFLEPDQRARLHAELSALNGRRAPIRSRSARVTEEADIAAIRLEARRLCEDMGARSLTLHKIVTIVSELARNIVSYAGSGTVELVPFPKPVPRMLIRAVDNGPGIPHLQQILKGEWRSKTGLGQGILGSKRLADRFHIETGERGTRVEVEVKL